MLANLPHEGPEEGRGFLPSAEIVSLFKITVGTLALHSLPSPTSWPLLRVTQPVPCIPPQSVAVIKHVTFTYKGPTWPSFNGELKTPGQVVGFLRSQVDLMSLKTHLLEGASPTYPWHFSLKPGPHFCKIFQGC